MFYLIGNSDEKKVIGHYPQLRVRNYGVDLGRIMRFDALPDIDPGIEIEFYNNSKRTDFLQRSPLSDGILISEKFVKEIINLNLPDHRFYPIRIREMEKSINEYFWFRFYVNIFKYLDFDKTIFKWVNNMDFTTISEFHVENREEFKQLLDKQTWDKKIMPVKIVFNSKFPNYDIFSLDVITSSIIVSEKFVNQIKTAGITGFELREYPIIEIE